MSTPEEPRTEQKPRHRARSSRRATRSRRSPTSSRRSRSRGARPWPGSSAPRSGSSLTMVLLATITHLVFKGVGIFGVNVPVGWGFDILNFVWWIGIGHAGTLISAILLLLRQPWRNSINRFAEAMTIFAVSCAGLYPLLHTGRPWLDYWLLPYPNTMGMWPNFRSPLIWDVFAVSTYATVSLLFWYVGMIPDLATLRDRAKALWAKIALRHARHGLARLGEALAPLRDGLAASRRARHAARRLGPHGRVLRLRRGHRAGLARHDLPALLRRRRDLRRLRDGPDARDPAAEDLRPRGLHHDEAPRQHGQDPPRDEPHRGLRLRGRGLHGVLQRQRLRALHDLEPHRPARTSTCTGPSSSATCSRRR